MVVDPLDDRTQFRTGNRSQQTTPVVRVFHVIIVRIHNSRHAIERVICVGRAEVR